MMINSLGNSYSAYTAKQKQVQPQKLGFGDSPNSWSTVKSLYVSNFHKPNQFYSSPTYKIGWDFSSVNSTMNEINPKLQKLSLLNREAVQEDKYKKEGICFYAAPIVMDKQQGSSGIRLKFQVTTEGNKGDNKRKIEYEVDYNESMTAKMLSENHRAAADALIERQESYEFDPNISVNKKNKI